MFKGEKIMNWFGNKITPRKSEVPAPKGICLARGLGFPAVGMIGFAVAGIEDIDPIPKMIGGAAGILFCIIGLIHILIYLSQIYKFNKYTPKWDKGRGFFDRFALEMNRMDETGACPSSCDSDMQYHLKLQRNRLDALNLRMHSQIFPSKDEGASTISTGSRLYGNCLLKILPEEIFIITMLDTSCHRRSSIRRMITVARICRWHVRTVVRWQKLANWNRDVNTAAPDFQ